MHHLSERVEGSALIFHFLYVLVLLGNSTRGTLKFIQASCSAIDTSLGGVEVEVATEVVLKLRCLFLLKFSSDDINLDCVCHL